MEKIKPARKAGKVKSPRKVARDGYVQVDWFDAHKEAETTLHKRPIDPRFSFTRDVWPAATEYYSPLNPIFLSEKFYPAQLNERTIWLARDGLVPLLWFFKRNPKPPFLKCTILVHEDFAPYVPNAWRPTIGTYRIQAEVPAKRVEAKTLLVMGSVADSYCSLTGLEDILDRLEQRITPERLAKLNKVCFLPVQLHLSANRETFQPAYFLELYRRLGMDFKPVRFGWIEGQLLLNETIVIDLNEKLVVADNFLMHTALQKGAQYLSLADNLKQSPGRFIRMSPYHGMIVTERLTGRCEIAKDSASEEYFERFERAMRSDANRAFPWPIWMTEWGLAISRANRESKALEDA
ncbi:MAG: hypothetical protein ABL958_15255 [Bdellovibrionia bacterium]